jgi:hypothetical protein
MRIPGFSEKKALIRSFSGSWFASTCMPVDEFGKYIQANLVKRNQEFLIHDGRPYKEYTMQSKNRSDLYDLKNSVDGIIRLRWEYYLNKNAFSKISLRLKLGNEVKYNFTSKGYFIKFFETWKKFLDIDNLIELTDPQSLNNLKIGDVLLADDELKTCLIILDFVKDSKAFNDASALLNGNFDKLSFYNSNNT